MITSVMDLFSIGIGPSSSHTVGPMRAAGRFLGELDHAGLLAAQSPLSHIQVILYGSLGATGRGHGSDGAVILGLIGADAETVDVDHIAPLLAQIRTEQKFTLKNGQTIPFIDGEHLKLKPGKRLPFHPNGLEFKAFNKKNELLRSAIYYSIGGGFVVSALEAEKDQFAPVDAPQPSPYHQPYAFQNAVELLDLCATHSLSIDQIMLANESALHGEPRVKAHLQQVWQVMQASVERGCRQEGLMPGLKLKRRAASLYRRLQNLSEAEQKDPLHVIDWVNLFALAVNEENASGGRVVTAPTNGAAGIIPAVLHYYRRFVAGADDEGVLRFLLTAGAIGKLFKDNASISGAEVGCQGEVGSACSMAAAGLASVMGGSPAQVENAAEIAMEHNLGLTCDPIGGYVQVPCIERNAMAAVKAINASRLALKGDGTHFVSLDKVIRTMRLTGRDMKSQYKETARGGLAVTIPINATIIDC